MSDIYDRIAIAAGELGIAVTASCTGEERKAAIEATAIIVPDRTFSYLQHAMAQRIPEWPEGTSFEPLSGTMKIHGIAILQRKEA